MAVVLENLCTFAFAPNLIEDSQHCCHQKHLLNIVVTKSICSIHQSLFCLVRASGRLERGSCQENFHYFGNCTQFKIS